MASEKELSDFLIGVEKRAFKRTLFNVRDEDAALDIVQDSMMKLAENYADKPVEELPMLFHRILSNSTLDWFRRKKTRNALFSNFGDFESNSSDEDFNILDSLGSADESEHSNSAENVFRSNEIVHEIEKEIENLPPRQREAFLLRYWEELDVAETAAAMGCTEGSVKTHCSRAIHSLMTALRSKGIEP